MKVCWMGKLKSESENGKGKVEVQMEIPEEPLYCWKLSNLFSWKEDSSHEREGGGCGKKAQSTVE